MELSNLREKIGFNVREYRLGRRYLQGLEASPVRLLEVSATGLADRAPTEQAIAETSTVTVSGLSSNPHAG